MKDNEMDELVEKEIRMLGNKVSSGLKEPIRAEIESIKE
jgi:hypothetical protein